MGDYVANQVIKLMNKKGVMVKDANILILGFTFKENCPDIRNSRIIDIYTTLSDYTGNITIYDPWANSDEVKREYGVNIVSGDFTALEKRFDAVVLAVAHNQFKSLNVRNFLSSDNGVVYDVKGILDQTQIDGRL